ncbi:MAG: InlB B-repeat-containing protein [Bacilli bacterium]|nr:InlB B-repeat-containing protein [Bacilli bacterium]
MNKLFTKIAGLSLGLVMAIGVGVAVASNSKEATPVHAADTELTFSLTSNPGSWPTSSSAGNYDYTLSGTKYTFALGANVYSSSGYLMLKYTTSLGLPAISGKKLTKIVASNSSGCSTSTQVGVSSSSSSASYISGGAVQTWSTTSSTYTYNLTSTSANTMYYLYITKKNCQITQLILTYASDSTPLAGITLGGAASSNAMSIGSSDLTAKTVSVTLNPSGSTDQKVNIAHQSGTSGLFTVSSSATCTSGSGSFTVTGKGNTSGTETFRISGNTETSVYVDLVVTALDDSVTYWTVSFDSDGGASIADMKVKDGEKFEFPSPGTKTHYSFDGWSSDGGNTLYDEGEESPAVGDDIKYTAYWTEDAKYTVTYVHGDHGTGDDYVVNNVYGGSYTLATFATAGFKASSGYSFKKWSVGGAEYAEGATVIISGATTVTAVYEEVTTYTIVTSVANLVEDTTFVLVYETSGSYYVDTAIASNHVALTAKTAATTISNGVSSGSTLVSTEAMVLTLKGSEGAWKIKCGDQYLKFTGTSNGNDVFDTEANASTFSASIKDNKYILFTCTSSTGNGRVWRLNTSSKDMRNYATNSGVGDVYMFAYIPPQNELSSIALSGDYKTSFASGETFSFGGTVTASYTLNDPANVTSGTTFHLDSASGTNMSGVTMTHAAHDGHTIYAKYTENDITKTATYTISVANAPVTSVSISVNAAEIGLNEEYSVSGITVTVLPADAIKTYVWTDVSNTVGGDYTFDGTELLSGDTAGTITLRCSSTADSTKYADLVVTVTGDPVVDITPASVSGYVGKSVDVDFTYGNIDDEELIKFASSDESVLTVGEHIEISGEGAVTINFVGAGSATLSVSYNGGSTLDSITVTVSTDSVTTLTWSAPTIKVYSGATTTVSDASSWNVHYTMASGDKGDLSYGEYTLKLGGSSITLPHIWDASEDGKVLSIEYGGFASPTTSTVDVTQTIRPVMMETTSSSDDTLTWTEKCNGAGTSSNSKSWTITSDGTESNFDGTKGIHYGTGKAAVKYIKATSSAYTTGKITKVVVNASTASGVTATVGVKIGGISFGGNPQSISQDAADYTFTGEVNASSIEVEVTKPESATNAIYLKSIIVTISTSSGTVDIANKSGHEAAQKAVVKFAKAFNTALGATEHCTTGLDAAWSTATTAWSTFNSDIALLSADEQTYAKNLIKYASAQYTKDTDNDYSYCLERAMATYETCIQKHGQTAFMSDVRLVSASSRIAPLSFINGDGNTIAIIVVISMISITAIGGYFFLRKRKED